MLLILINAESYELVSLTLDMEDCSSLSFE